MSELQHAALDVAEVTLRDLADDGVDLDACGPADIARFAHRRWGWPEYDPLCPPYEVTLRAVLLWERWRSGEVPAEPPPRRPEPPTETARRMAELLRVNGINAEAGDGATLTITMEDD